ncbi:MAG: biotin--[acetyl-CoA-carboxylase] ligase [Treponema sp.]|jgi:BirA family biotin operon repressor/biotin-[acetyl-CoA-carboxylase] ligase|nr:biotin--[acetyl-CoA-carboxylase] ligase [Treponema sp.]
MDNRNGLSTKAYLLKKLREAERSVSGSELGKEAGVSRVAVWKGIHSLIEAGYPIHGDDQGYRIIEKEDGDFLYPWEFGTNEENFHHWESTDSTMNRAKDLADKGAESGAVCIAEKQSNGRGRQGRNWDSAVGGLFFTLLERPTCSVQDYVRYAMALQCCAAKVISTITGQKAWLTWPNDIYVDAKKIAGILSELYAEGDRITWLTLGLGININNPAVSLDMVNCASLAGRECSRRQVLSAILAEWTALKQYGVLEGSVAQLWNQAAWGVGMEVRYSPQRTGVFLGIDEEGRGLVKTDNSIEQLSPGVASLRFV